MKSKTIQIYDVDVNNLIISKLVETKKNSNYLIGHFDKVIRPLVLIMPKMIGHGKIFKLKYGEKDKNNKMMS